MKRPTIKVDNYNKVMSYVKSECLMDLFKAVANNNNREMIIWEYDHNRSFDQGEEVFQISSNVYHSIRRLETTKTIGPAIAFTIKSFEDVTGLTKKDILNILEPVGNTGIKIIDDYISKFKKIPPITKIKEALRVENPSAAFNVNKAYRELLPLGLNALTIDYRLVNNIQPKVKASGDLSLMGLEQFQKTLGKVFGGYIPKYATSREFGIKSSSFSPELVSQTMRQKSFKERFFSVMMDFYSIESLYEPNFPELGNMKVDFVINNTVFEITNWERGTGYEERVEMKKIKMENLGFNFFAHKIKSLSIKGIFEEINDCLVKDRIIKKSQLKKYKDFVEYILKAANNL